MAEDDLQKWVAKRVRELEGHRIWWTGKDGNPVHVKLQLKEVELSARPERVGPGSPPSLTESATVRFTPAPRHDLEEEPDAIDSIASAILAVDANGGSDDEIERLWGRLKGEVSSVYGDCNIIPGDAGAPCFERLMIFPEHVSVLARHRRLPNTLEFCGNELQQLTRGYTGICCALCEGTVHAQQCFRPPKWMNRIIDVRGDYSRVRRAWAPHPLCQNWWSDEDVVLPRSRARVVDEPDNQSESAAMTPEQFEKIIPCWAHFIGAVKRLRALSGAPNGCPVVLLAGRRVALH
ncbi:MAG: hypothetical protein JRN50_04110 [Nitrososphaerota archaeon]|nr:hypothetical protein [Nitrososphaerota archaeon]